MEGDFCYAGTQMSKIIGIIYKLKSVFPVRILKSIYNSLLLPHMSYCILSLSLQIDNIRQLQKRVIRNIPKSAYTARIKTFTQEISWKFRIYMYNVYQLVILKFYCKLVNNNFPQSFNAFTSQLSLGQIKYNLRNSTSQIPVIRH